MKVSELAKELGTTTDKVLVTLKSFRLKAKDGDQELSVAVASVVRSELAKTKKASVKMDEKPVAKESAKASKPAKKVLPAKPTAKKEVKKDEEEAAAPKVTKPVEKKPEVQLVKAPPVDTAVEKRPVPATKPKAIFSKEPMVALKPLVRKKRKMGGAEQRGFPTSHDSAISDVVREALMGGAQQMATAGTEVLPAQTKHLVDLEIDLPISVKDFSTKVQQKPSVILKSLMQSGILTMF